MEECIQNHRRSGALASIFVSWAICWGGVTAAWWPDTTIRWWVVATCTSYARRAESMNGGQVVRHSPLHSNKKGTVINRHLRFPRYWSRIQTGSASWRSGINPVSLDTALRTRDKALSHVPPLCSYITRITRILYPIALCGSNTRCLYSRVSRYHCSSRSGHPTFPIRKFRIRSTRKWGPVSGKINLQRTQTGFKVSAGDWDLRPVVKAARGGACAFTLKIVL